MAKISPTEQMIADLIAHDGELKIPRPERKSYEGRIAAAIRFGKVPEGKRLVTDGFPWSDNFAVRLEDAPEWLNAQLDPIDVPTALRKPHPVVASLQTRDSMLRVDRSLKHRALLIVQALAVEAERRGYSVKATEVHVDRYGYRSRETKDQFAITIDRLSVGVQLHQEIDRVRHEPTPADLARAERESWFRVPKFDDLPSDRLRIDLSGGYEHRQSRWKDSTSHRLEEWLPQILQEIELRAAAAEAARLAAIAEAAERRRRWELAMEAAKVDFAEAHRWDVFNQEVDDWLRANHVRAYLQAMGSAIEAIAHPEDSLVARQWLGWASAHAADLDPLVGRLAIPDAPKPKAEDLAPFLRGWSPYGP